MHRYDMMTTVSIATLKALALSLLTLHSYSSPASNNTDAYLFKHRFIMSFSLFFFFFAME